MSNKYKLKSVFYHKEKNIFLMVNTVERIASKGILYRLKVLTNSDQHGEWKAYYEHKLDKECIEVDVNQLQTVTLLYG